MKNLFFTAMVGAIVMLSACHSAPKKNAEQQIVPAENKRRLSERLDSEVFKYYGQWKDDAAERILNKLVQQIASSDPTYEDQVGARVKLLGATTPLVAPGIAQGIYISRGMLGTIRYENELAFVLACQLALLKENTTAQNLANLHGQDVGENIVTLPTAPPSLKHDYLASGWFEPGGLFDFGETTYIKAQEEGIRLMSKAKYDPRGAVSLIQRWINLPTNTQMRALQKILPESSEQLNSAREEVAKTSPMRDPIVKSQAFAELEARLQIKKAKLKKGPSSESRTKN